MKDIKIPIKLTDTIDIYRLLHSTTSDYTFSTRTGGHFAMINCMLCYKTSKHFKKIKSFRVYSLHKMELNWKSMA